MFLALTADLDGVTNLAPEDTEDAPFEWTFKVQCTACREVHKKPVTLNRFETTEIPGSRGEANFVWSCGCGKKTSNATIKGPAKPYTKTDPPTRQNILELECRGLEFVDFIPNGPWKCEGDGTKTKFTEMEIDIDNAEWWDYDPERRQPGNDAEKGHEVKITDMKWEIRRT